MLLYLAMLSSRSTYILSTSLKRNRQQQGYYYYYYYVSFFRKVNEASGRECTHPRLSSDPKGEKSIVAPLIGTLGWSPQIRQG